MGRPHLVASSGSDAMFLSKNHQYPNDQLQTAHWIVLKTILPAALSVRLGQLNLLFHVVGEEGDGIY